MAISVAIVAILAAIAIPSVGWMIARARQSEARSNLSSIHDLESAYHFENHAFGTLTDIGFAPEGENRYGYCAGNIRAVGSCVQSATDVFDFATGGGGVSAPGWHGHLGCPSPLGCATPTPPPPPTPRPGSIGICIGNPHASTDDFEADAYGRISQNPPPHDLDCWLIDQDQALTNYAVGY